MRAESVCWLLLGWAVAVACGSSDSTGPGDEQGGAAVGGGGNAGERADGGRAHAGERSVSAGQPGEPGRADGGAGGAAGATAASEPIGGAEGVQPAGGAGGAAGASGSGAEGGDAFDPGQCEQGSEAVAPTVPASCAHAAADDACKTCVKAKACTQYQSCYGTSPVSACGTGLAPGEPGQFECVRQCFAAGANQASDPNDLLATCAEDCAQTCSASVLNTETSDLLGAVEEKCWEACFPID